jgi:CxxC-x17-CxxC domain-containing protein
MPYQDKHLLCRDCGKAFIWTAGEQEFYASKGFTNPPSRCKEHRLQRRAQVDGTRGLLPQRKEYDIVCSNCGRPGKVPFEPSTKQSLLCTDCFLSQRAAKVAPHPARVAKDNATKVEKMVLKKNSVSRAA